MRLKTKISAAAVSMAALCMAAPAFAAFTYSVTYSDTASTATYPATATITTTDPSTSFTVAPGGDTSGILVPSEVGLFTLTPTSTAAPGAGPFTVTSTNFTDTFSLQTVANANGTGPIGAPATFTVTGTISGTLGPNSDNTTISNIAGLPATVTAGNVPYSITLNSVRNPGIVSSSGNTGGVTLTIAAIPEPATFSLMGLSSLGLLIRRRSIQAN